MRIYNFLQSYTAVTQFCNHYMQLHSSTIITCSYTVLQSFRELHSSTIIPCSYKSSTIMPLSHTVLQSSRTLSQFYSYAVQLHFHSSTVMLYSYVHIQSFPTVLQFYSLIQTLSMTTVLCKMWNSWIFIISFVGYFAPAFYINLTCSKVLNKSDRLLT